MEQHPGTQPSIDDQFFAMIGYNAGEAMRDDEMDRTVHGVGEAAVNGVFFDELENQFAGVEAQALADHAAEEAAAAFVHHDEQFTEAELQAAADAERRAEARFAEALAHQHAEQERRDREVIDRIIAPTAPQVPAERVLSRKKTGSKSPVPRRRTTSRAPSRSSSLSNNH